MLRSGPSASISMVSVLSASRAAASEAGSRWAPPTARSASLRVAGSTFIGLPRVQLAADAVQAGVDEPAEREVGVGAGIGRLQLQVDRTSRVPPQRRADPDRGLPVVHPVAGVRAGPHLRREPAVAVHAGAGQRDQGGQVGEQPADEVVADLGQAVAVGGVGEHVTPAGLAVRQEVGERGVQVSAVAGLVGDRLGGQAGPQAVPERHAADGLPVQHVVIGGAQRVGVPDGELMLAVAEFGVVVLDREILRLERGDEFHGEVVRQVEAGGGVAQAVVDRDQPVRDRRPGGGGLAAAEGELGLERGLHRVSLAGQLDDGLLEERPRAGLPRRSVRPHQVGQHRPGAGGIGEHYEGIRVGHDTDLADRPHPGHRL